MVEAIEITHFVRKRPFKAEQDDTARTGNFGGEQLEYFVESSVCVGVRSFEAKTTRREISENKTEDRR